MAADQADPDKPNKETAEQPFDGPGLEIASRMFGHLMGTISTSSLFAAGGCICAATIPSPTMRELRGERWARSALKSKLAQRATPAKRRNRGLQSGPREVAIWHEQDLPRQRLRTGRTVWGHSLWSRPRMGTISLEWRASAHRNSDPRGASAPLAIRDQDTWRQDIS